MSYSRARMRAKERTEQEPAQRGRVSPLASSRPLFQFAAVVAAAAAAGIAVWSYATDDGPLSRWVLAAAAAAVFAQGLAEAARRQK